MGKDLVKYDIAFTLDSAHAHLQFGFRFAGQSATGHPLLLVMRMGRLYPSTSDTVYLLLARGFFPRIVQRVPCHHRSRDCHLLQGSIPQPSRAVHPGSTFLLRNGLFIGRVSETLTVPDRGSQLRPPLHPPVRQELGPEFLEKSQ